VDVEKALTVGEVAARSGVAVSTLHYYEAQGLSRLSSKWKAELDERIAGLVQLRDRLGECIGCGCLSMRNCWLRNPWDRLSAQGPGPRLLRVP
jgi:MerR family transcriptional regulator, redox-sensitive transcriptional activator SoxR